MEKLRGGSVNLDGQFPTFCISSELMTRLPHLPPPPRGNTHPSSLPPCCGSPSLGPFHHCRTSPAGGPRKVSSLKSRRRCQRNKRRKNVATWPAALRKSSRQTPLPSLSRRSHMLFSCCRVTAPPPESCTARSDFLQLRQNQTKANNPPRAFQRYVPEWRVLRGSADRTDRRLHHSGPGLQEEGQPSVERTEAAVGSTSPPATVDRSSSGAPCGGGQRVTKNQPQSPELTKPLLFFWPV